MKLKQHKLLFNSLSSGLAKILGEKIEHVLLFGSYARGDARHDSDLDILVVVRGECDYAILIRQTSYLIAHLSLENDLVISRAFMSNERIENDHSPFTLSVQREGIAI